eukprot:3523708-Pyramimonas_sp.AAC.2
MNLNDKVAPSSLPLACQVNGACNCKASSFHQETKSGIVKGGGVCIRIDTHVQSTCVETRTPAYDVDLWGVLTCVLRLQCRPFHGALLLSTP